MHSRTALLILTVLAVAGCLPRPTNVGEIVDAGPPSTLTATGRVCTTALDPTGFPVKVVFLVDQSGPSCFTDPPGFEASPGRCEQAAVVPPGVTQPARVRALNRVMDRLQTMPNVSIALVPFQTNVVGVWPVGPGARFGRPDAFLRNRVNTLQAELGGASDFQGALAFAHGLISADVSQTERSNPEELPRTYRVVFLANGPAFQALIPQVLRGTASQGAWVLDDDGDGASNDVEASAGTDPAIIDTDGDGFDDQFEVTHRATSFDPLVRDQRGCDPASPLTRGCVARDFDGDGLSQFAEAFLQTSVTMADTDRDGLPDGLEVRWGLDPRVRLDPLSDVDGDGVADLDEVLRGSDPGTADAAFPGSSITIVEGALGSDGRRCYDFTITHLPMLDTPAHVGPIPPGVNLFKLWFAEAPRDLPEDGGTWSSACFFARRDLSQTPPILVPDRLSQSVSTTNFVALTASVFGRTEPCAGTEALTP